jgi:hypothetical protein
MPAIRSAPDLAGAPAPADTLAIYGMQACRQTVQNWGNRAVRR